MRKLYVAPALPFQRLQCVCYRSQPFSHTFPQGKGTSYTTPYAWTTQESAPSNAAKVTTRTDPVISSTLTFRTDAQPTSMSQCVTPSSLLSWQRVPSAQVSQRKLVRLPRTCTMPQLWSRLEECSFRWQWNRLVSGLHTALRHSKGSPPARPPRVASRPIGPYRTCCSSCQSGCGNARLVRSRLQLLDDVAGWDLPG